MGIACTTNLRSISFPPTNNILSFHPSIFIIIDRSNTGNSRFYPYPHWLANPKYLSLRATVITFRVVQIRSMSSTFVFGLKNMLAFPTINKFHYNIFQEQPLNLVISFVDVRLDSTQTLFFLHTNPLYPASYS